MTKDEGVGERDMKKIDFLSPCWFAKSESQIHPQKLLTSPWRLLSGVALRTWRDDSVEMKKHPKRVSGEVKSINQHQPSKQTMEIPFIHK